MTEIPLSARMLALANALHAEARSSTARRSYAQGTALRCAANCIREELGLEPLPYDGPEEDP